ncbi:hypothetical protein AKJ38_01510 [candidate division MSBL1 archaeon SCGC-AAA259I14]|uniref:Uncharacterized protein n=1 Tax=candidate division MSBL1 archaeon SCGC-AAA259I14 TaxID=1698268 RepID=A0A133UT33_9EURY|nr:hypothetical protein AKJ38_01510 [candidate division MSBL1 archaeon SCGC-AAA259I14]
MKTSAQPQIVPDAEIRDRLRSVAGGLLTEELVPEGLQGKVWIIVNPDGALSISRCYLEDQEFEEYLEWVRSTPEISESVRWDDVIFPGEYQVPRGILTEMVRSVEPYRKMHQLPKSKVLESTVEIYHRLRGEPHSEEFCSFMGWVLARTNRPDLEETCERLKENIRGAVGQTLESRPDGSNVVEIILDETWKRVLNILWNYGLAEATLEGDGDMLTLEGKEKSSHVQVKAELQGPATKGSGLEKLGINVGTLFEALKEFGTPKRVEVQRDGGETRVRSLNPSRIEPGRPVGEAPAVKKPYREESPDPDIKSSVEAEGVDLGLRISASRKIHGIEGFRATITVEDGKLLLYYWTEGSPDGLKSILGKVQGDEVSSTYSPELLEPLKGKWDIKLGVDAPLRAEKAIDKGEGGGEADITVVVPPKAENAGTSLPGSSLLFLKA